MPSWFLVSTLAAASTPGWSPPRFTPRPAPLQLCGAKDGDGTETANPGAGGWRVMAAWQFSRLVCVCVCACTVHVYINMDVHIHTVYISYYIYIYTVSYIHICLYVYFFVLSWCVCPDMWLPSYKQTEIWKTSHLPTIFRGEAISHACFTDIRCFTLQIYGHLWGVGASFRPLFELFRLFRSVHFPMFEGSLDPGLTWTTDFRSLVD